MAAASPSYPRVKVDFALTPENLVSNPPDRPLDGVQDVYGGDDNDNRSKLVYHTAEEEIAMAPACWLWDYLRYMEKFVFEKSWSTQIFLALIRVNLI